MGILQQWHDIGYSKTTPQKELTALWKDYFEVEKGIYAKILGDPESAAPATVQEYADRFGVTLMEMTAFLDGIQDSLKEPNPIEEMEADTKVQLDYDTRKLYKNMLSSGADWLYNLPEWGPIYTDEEREEITREWRSERTVRKEAKVYPNDPCPCGSGKKYKKCHGKGVAE